MPPDARAKTLTGADEDALQKQLYALKATDGLPVILPTADRVAQMLEAAAFAGYEPDIVIGEVGPNMGQATIEKIAINAVMAGCGPEHLPVVIAAVSALCDPQLDTTEFAVTTHQVTPMLIVNGPAIREAGIATGYGALGYGHRANLTIGRAVRLCLINLGGVWPGESAMAVLGQPSSIACCLGEAEEASPFPPLHTTLGFDADSSAVTVACVGAPISVLVPPTPDDAPISDRLFDLIAQQLSAIGHNTAVTPRGSVVVVLNPDHAHALARDGHDRASIAHELIRRTGNRAGAVMRARNGGIAPDPDAFVPAIAGTDHLLIVVSGGGGLYSTVLSSWGGGPHGNAHVSREIIFSDACEVAFDHA